MIHTDGRPTIANAPRPRKNKAASKRAFYERLYAEAAETPFGPARSLHETHFYGKVAA